MSVPDVSTSLRTFIDRALAISGRDWFESPADPDWRSPCELGEPVGDISRWHPAKQAPAVDFRGLANALEVPVHKDICVYYGTFWSGSFEARSQEGPVSLIQLWNHEDFERLIENLLGHALAKRRSKQPFTAFFANTHIDSELFLSIDNDTGNVLLEEPGKPPLKVVAKNVAQFLDRLDPRDSSPSIY